MTKPLQRWVCCQIGAREHYSVARGLQACDCLDHLVTDVWSRPGSLPQVFPKGFARVRQRFHPEVADDKVRSFNAAALAYELGWRLRRRREWEQVIARNDWFQKRARRHLGRIQFEFSKQRRDAPPVLFSYSYAARGVFEFAKQHGWRTVLGQIDPGPVEERLVAEEHARQTQIDSSWRPAPASYWTAWRQECELADHIVVNSRWSQTALEEEGIDATKIQVIPLAYNAPAEASRFERRIPREFSPERPLRVLFLGQIILRKGLAALLDAAKLLENEPIEFQMVGSLGIKLSAEDLARPNIRWFGSVPRARVHDFYKSSDVFLFPTLSDGFGLTQLEAQAWKLPLIASRNCAEVVKPGVNGLLLNDVSGPSVATALRQCLESPEQLATFGSNSSVPDECQLRSVSRMFAQLVVD